MKLSESWLREWVNPELTTQELADQITMAGLEVDAIEAVAAEFSGVVVGEIVSVEPHPDADKLRVCQVSGQGDTTTQVVCGAPNARVGIKIPFATVGAVLPENFKIKKAKLRGVESFGMLCGQTELQLGDDDDGLWELPIEATVGQDLRDYLVLNDMCIDIDLTPNRSDCLSVKGVARDIGVLNRLPVNEVLITPAPTTSSETIDISLIQSDMCPRYVGRIIRHVDLSRPTPLWMREKLRRAGVGSKDIAVDVTNYVLLELGQPMHAFDLDKLSGGITVRKAVAQENIELLNGQTIELNEDTLVIADESGAIAVAGIMGGSQTAVSDSTKNLFLESAFFSPTAIAGRARSYGLHTDSSHRFERGVDYRLQEQAIERATQLITELAGGEVASVVVAEEPHDLTNDKQVVLRRQRIELGLGFAMSDEDVLDILQRLGLKKLEDTNEGWILSVPSYRFDISIEADLLEELARVYGYNRLPTRDLLMAMELPDKTESVASIHDLSQRLLSRDYQEAICYSFIDPELQKLFNPDMTPIALKNPISTDMGVMRTSLWPGLIQALQHNVNRQQHRVRLFETGQRFVSIDGSLGSLDQEPVIAGLLYGKRENESWLATEDNVDFYDLKGDVESLLCFSGDIGQFSFRAVEHPALHPGQTAEIILKEKSIGVLGALHPQLQQKLGLAQSVYLFEISQAAILGVRLPRFSPLSKFPEVRRDIAIIVDQSVSVADLQNKVVEAAGDSLKNLKVFDVYIGKGIDSHRKSVALGLTFQHLSRTLTDEEITNTVDSVVQLLEQAFDAVLR